ncbi:MAG: ribonuclease M5, partial [Fusobacteriaceae bacterium]
MRKIINEIIVVEGRDDISAVKAAVDAEVVAVHGFSVRRGQNLDKLATAYKNRGLIILTDPDYAGEQIRRAIMSRYPNSKNAYISRDEGTKGDDIGVENANPEAIIKALETVKIENPTEKIEIFTMEDLIDNGLTGGESAKEKREKLGKILSIGYSNSKQLLSKLNRYSISREEFEEA